MKKLAVLLLSLSVTAGAFAVDTYQDFKHPNLRDADKEVVAATHHIEDAQRDNPRGEFRGHAEKAKQLLEAARQEIFKCDAIAQNK